MHAPQPRVESMWFHIIQPRVVNVSCVSSGLVLLCIIWTVF